MISLVLLLSLAVSAAASPPGAVSAATACPGLPPPFPRALHAEALNLLMDRFDTDRNGKLDDEERRPLRAFAEQLFLRKKKAILARYDRNGDGRLDADEEAALRKDWERAHPGIGRLARQREREQRRSTRLVGLRRFDGDGDGNLDENELAAVRRWVERKQCGREGPPAHPSVNGRSSSALSAENPPPVIPAIRVHTLPPEAGIVLEHLLLERYDADGDGFLSPPEIKAALDRRASRGGQIPGEAPLFSDPSPKRKELDESR